MKKNEIIKAKSYKDAKNIYRTLDNKVRLRILEILDEDGPQSVSYLTTKLKIAYAVVSTHLAVLRKYKIVISGVGATDTRQRLYSINKKVLINYNDITKKLLQSAEELLG